MGTAHVVAVVEEDDLTPGRSEEPQCRFLKQSAVVKRRQALERVRRKMPQFDRFGSMAVECRKATFHEGGFAVAHYGDLGKLGETSEFY